jgi:hypothetical protein
VKLHVQTPSQSFAACCHCPGSSSCSHLFPSICSPLCSAGTIHCCRRFAIITIPLSHRCLAKASELSSQKQFKRPSLSSSSNFQQPSRDTPSSPPQHHHHVRPPFGQEPQLLLSTEQHNSHICKHTSTMPHPRPSRHHPRGRQVLRCKAEGVQRADRRAEQVEGPKSVQSKLPFPLPSILRSHCSTCEHCEISF